MKTRMMITAAFAAVALSASAFTAEAPKTKPAKPAGEAPSKVYATVEIAGSEDLTAFAMDYSRRIEAQQLGMLAAMAMAGEPMKTFGPTPKDSEAAIAVFGPAQLPADLAEATNFSFAVFYPLSRKKSEILAANPKLKEKDGLVRLPGWYGKSAYAAIGDGLAAISSDRRVAERLKDAALAAKMAASCGVYAKGRLIQVTLRRPALDMLAAVAAKHLEDSDDDENLAVSKPVVEEFLKLLKEIDRMSLAVETEKDALLVKIGSDCREGGRLMKCFGAGLPAQALDFGRIPDDALGFSSGINGYGLLPESVFREQNWVNQLSQGLSEIAKESSDAKVKTLCAAVSSSLKKISDKCPLPRDGEWAMAFLCSDFAGSFLLDCIGGEDPRDAEFLALVDGEFAAMSDAAKVAYPGKTFVTSKKDGSRYQYTVDLDAIVAVANDDAKEAEKDMELFKKAFGSGKAVVELDSPKGKASRLVVRSEKGADSFKATGVQKRSMEKAFPGVFGKEKVCACGRFDICGIVRAASAIAEDALDPAVVNGLLPKDGTPGVAWMSTWKGKSFAGTLRLPDADIRAISTISQLAIAGAGDDEDEDDEDDEVESADDADEESKE